MYLTDFEDCKSYLYGKIILSKGEKPFTHMNMCKKLDLVWKYLKSYKVILLGRGFYEFAFSSL